MAEPVRTHDSFERGASTESINHSGRAGSASGDASYSFETDRRAEHWDGGAPLRPGASVSGAVNRFSPMDIPSDVWARIERVVKAAVMAATPDTPLHANHQLSIVTQLAVWADRIGQPLDPEVLFHPETIDRFIGEGCAHLSEGSRLNYRTHLWKVGAAVLGHELFPPRALPLRRSDVLPPYTAVEVTDLTAWARGLPTEHMRRNTLALLSIGLGAGLTSREIERIVGTDVRTDDGLLVVEVIGEAPRTVPVRRRWASDVLAIAEESGDRPFYRPERKRITRRDILAFVGRCSGGGPTRYNVQQLRVTWIVAQLSVGVPLQVLAPAAGAGAGQLVKYLPFAEAPPERAGYEALAGVSS